MRAVIVCSILIWKVCFPLKIMTSPKAAFYFVRIRGISRLCWICRGKISSFSPFPIIIPITLELKASPSLANGLDSIRSIFSELEILPEKLKKSIKRQKTESISAFRLFLMMEITENTAEKCSLGIL